MIAAIALSALDVSVLIAYLAILAGMGVFFARRKRDSSDYFLASQKIPWWAAALSLLGTSLSAITFLAIPAKAYQTDWVYLLGNLMILAVAPPVIWYYLPFYRRLKVTSAYRGLFGGGLAGMFVAGIFTRRVRQTGVLIGFAVSAVMLYAVSTSGTVHFFLYGAIGILTCSVGGWLASVAIPGPNQDLIGLTVHSLNRDADVS